MIPIRIWINTNLFFLSFLFPLLQSINYKSPIFHLDLIFDSFYPFWYILLNSSQCYDSDRYVNDSLWSTRVTFFPPSCSCCSNLLTTNHQYSISNINFNRFNPFWSIPLNFSRYCNSNQYVNKPLTYFFFPSCSPCSNQLTTNHIYSSWLWFSLIFS